MKRHPFTLEFCLRQHAAAVKDAASYQAAPQRDENGEKVSRNRFTNERGITYIRSTRRYRTFAHAPYYFYVGTFQELDVAVQARDAAEAQSLQLLYHALPEAKPGADNPKGIAIRMQKLGSKTILVNLTSGRRKWDASFTDYDQVLQWLKKIRPTI